MFTAAVCVSQTAFGCSVMGILGQNHYLFFLFLLLIQASIKRMVYILMPSFLNTALKNLFSSFIAVKSIVNADNEAILIKFK